jgi:hypothetical protein
MKLTWVPLNFDYATMKPWLPSPKHSLMKLTPRMPGCGPTGEHGKKSSPNANFGIARLATDGKPMERKRRSRLVMPIPQIVLNEHFGRRLEMLLDEAENSGAYTEVTKDEFDAMEREGLELARKTKTP